MTSPARHYPPRGMRSPEAAAYLGMGETKFRAVDAGRLPRPATVDGMVAGIVSTLMSPSTS
jgi:hypothetical protein